MLRGVLALVVAVVAISWAAILIRLCDAPSLGIATYRVAFATLALAPWAARGAVRVAPANLGPTLLAGALLAAHFGTWITALSMTSVASAVILVSCQPVFTALLGPLYLGERPGRDGWLGAGLALAGIVLLAEADLGLGRRALIGDLLALLGALTAALYLMTGRRLRERIAFGPYLLLVNASAALLLGSLAALGAVPLSGYPAATWGWLLLLAAGPHLVGHGLLNWSVRRLRSFAVALAALGEPVLATTYAWLLLGETPPVAFYPGALLIGAGILLAMREEVRMPRL